MRRHFPGSRTLSLSRSSGETLVVRSTKQKHPSAKQRRNHPRTLCHPCQTACKGRENASAFSRVKDTVLVAVQRRDAGRAEHETETPISKSEHETIPRSSSIFPTFPPLSPPSEKNRTVTIQTTERGRGRPRMTLEKTGKIIFTAETETIRYFTNRKTGTEQKTACQRNQLLLQKLLQRHGKIAGEIPGERVPCHSGALGKLRDIQLRTQMILNMPEEPAIPPCQTGEIAERIRIGEGNVTDHPPEKRLERTDRRPVREIQNFLFHLPALHRIHGELPAEPLLLKQIHPGQKIQIEMTAQELQTSVKLKTQIRRLRHEKRRTPAKTETLVSRMIANTPFALPDKKTAVERIAVSSAPFEIGGCKLVDPEMDHIVKVPPLRIFQNRHKIIFFLRIFAFKIQEIRCIIISQHRKKSIHGRRIFS